MSHPATLRRRSIRPIGETTPMTIEIFTIREAAEKCGLSYEAMRKRVDRGSVKTNLKGGVRLIHRSQLEEAGLWPVPQGGDPELLKENEELRKEVEQYKVLTEQAQSTAEAERTARAEAEASMSKAQAERLAAEQVAKAQEEKAEALRADLEEISNAGPFKALRMRRRIRENLSDAA